MYKKSGKLFAGRGLYLPPLLSVFVRQKAKSCPTMTKIIRGQDTQYISIYQTCDSYVIFMYVCM